MGHPFRLVSQLNPVVISGNVTMSGAPAISIDGNTAGVPAIISDGTLQLAGGNNITLSQNGSSITISAANLGAGAGVVLYDGANSITSGTARFSNANGISFGFNGQTITGSHNGLTSQSNQAYSAGNGSAAFQTLSFADSNGVSFSTGTQGLYATVKTDYLTSQSNQAVSAANGSFTFQTLTVANSNGVSFSTGTQGLYATVKTDYLTTARASNDAIGLNTAQSNVTWTVNSAGLSLDARGYAGTGTSATNASVTLNSDGLAISVAAPGAGGGVGIEAGTRTATTAGTLRFETGNGITFGLDSPGGSVMTASHNGLTTARASNDAVGLNTALTAGPLAWTVNSSGISLNAGSAAGTTSGFGGNLISGSMTHNTAGLNLSLDHPAWLTTAMQSNAATISNIRVSGGTTSNLLSAITFADSNGVSFGLNAGTMTATVKTDYLTSQSNQAVSANNGSYAFQTLSFSNANGISFGTSAGSAITASHNAITTARASTDAIGLNTAQSNVTWTVNSSGLSLDARGYAGTGTSATNASITLNSNGLAISVAAPGAGGGIGIEAGTRTATTAGTLRFETGNGITFGLDSPGGSVMTASHNGLTTARASTDAIGLNTAQTNVTWTVNSSGLSLNAAGYAGTGTSKTGGAVITLNSNGLAFDGSALAGTATTFNGANISGSMTVNTAGVNLSMSVAAPGAAAENNNINLLGANTAGNTTASGSTIGYSGINLTLSGTNNSVVNISAPATSSLSATGQLSISTNGSTISIGVGRTISNLVLAPNGGLGGPLPFAQSSISLGQNSLYVYPFQIEDYLSADQIRMPVFLTNSSSAVSSGQKAMTFLMGIYTRNATNNTVLSQHYSTSYTIKASYSSNVSWALSMITGIGNSTSYNTVTASSAGLNLSASLHGPRELLMPLSSVLEPGEYWFALKASSAGSGTVGNVLNISNLAVAHQTYNRPGQSTATSNSAYFQQIGMGLYSATTAALPAGISQTQLNLMGTQPIMFAGTGTV